MTSATVKGHKFSNIKFGKVFHEAKKDKRLFKITISLLPSIGIYCLPIIKVKLIDPQVRVCLHISETNDFIHLKSEEGVKVSM